MPESLGVLVRRLKRALPQGTDAIRAAVRSWFLPFVNTIPENQAGLGPERELILPPT